MTIGEQNHNPLNIRYSKGNKWVGKIIGPQNGFESFSNDMYGIRAGIIILRTYYYKYNIFTLRGLIEKFAPHTENDTDNYINVVSAISKIKHDAKLAWTKDNICRIVQGMIKMEIGKLYPLSFIETAWEIV